MAAYIVGYDLNRPGQNYDSLITALKAYGTHWHLLDSTWIIRTTQSAAQVRDNLQKHIDSNDKLLVAELNGVAAWIGFDSAGTAWLQDVLTNR